MFKKKIMKTMTDKKISTIAALGIAIVAVIALGIGVTYLALGPSINLPTTISGSSAVYYVDNLGGNDANDGLSEVKAFQTLNKINSLSITPGSKVLFKRGGKWLGTLNPPYSGAASQPIIYDAYGTGNNPIIYGSISVDWQPVSGKAGVFQASLSSLNQIGLITKNDSPLKFVAWPGNFSLTKAGSYQVDPNNKIAYVWPADGNTTGIEIANTFLGVDIENKEYITVQNLTIEKTSFHGVYIGNSQNITVQNLIVRNIGGYYSATSGLYIGNGIEFGANSSNITIANNKIYEIFDSGISPQTVNSGDTASNSNITNNEIYNCGYAGIEVYALGANSKINNINISGNNIHNSGNGFTGIRYDKGAGIFLGVGNNTSLLTSINIINSNKIYSNANTGIIISTGDTGSSVNISNNEIYNNINSGIYGVISATAGIRGSITNNNIHNNNAANKGQAAGLYLVYNNPNSTLNVTGNIFASNSINNVAFYQLNNNNLINNNTCNGAPCPTNGPVCNNGVIETGEVCDGLNLNNQTCATVNSATPEGTLKCSADCRSVDASGCTAKVCTPKTCASLGYTCDTASDGCGKTITCGTCTSAQACTNNVCQIKVCTDSNCCKAKNSSYPYYRSAKKMCCKTIFSNTCIAR